MYFAQSCLAMMEADSLILPCQGHEPLKTAWLNIVPKKNVCFYGLFFRFYFDAE